MNSFKRLITPANKPQGFGFAEFQDPDGALRAMTLLNGVELPALEDGCVNKKLLVSSVQKSVCIELTAMTQVKADEKTKMFLDAYQAQKMVTPVRPHLRILNHPTVPWYPGGRRIDPERKSEG